MPLHVALSHSTTYDYDRRVQMGPQVIRLRPAPHGRTPILSYSLEIYPQGYFLNWQQDPHGNYLARLVFPDPVDHFHVSVDLVAEMQVFNPFDFFLEPDAETVPFAYEPELLGDLDPYLEAEAATPRFREWLDSLPKQTEQRTADFIVELNRRIHASIRYLVRMEPGVQTAEETLTQGSGSCRDSGWLLVQTLRHLGFASRFVSGYLIQLVADVKSLDGPSGTEADFTDLHAWAEVYLPGAGWVGLDPTSGLMAGEGHIPLAATPHPISAAPITGSVDPCETRFAHEMSVTRIRETPRVTKPYSDEQWADIDAFGREIDARLTRQDVRLTIGGEPTFVSRDHPDAAEWNTAATGPTKRKHAYEMIRRLRDRFAPEGLLHFGQGKWYPGEQLPRWAFSLYWRRDGKTLWSEHGLVAAEGHDYRASTEQSAKLLEAVAARLDVDAMCIAPVYEDPWHFLDQKRRLPENLTPGTNELDDPMARSRLARVFERGLGTAVGHVLPLQVWQAKDGSSRWTTQSWSTRAGKLYLVPGDSPVGFRLPIPSLPHLAPSEYPYIIPTDPMADSGELPDAYAHRQPFRQRRRTGGASGAAPQALVPQHLAAAGGDIRAALTVEPRDGHLCIFLPPVAALEDYLDLVAAIEDASAEVEIPVSLEGYEPPKDSRLNVIKVTPDPGVLEVNIHPARSWDELVAITEGLYEDAHFSRLVTEKFMLDGRHTGTGGGCHVVLGGSKPSDSPFLRRPHLLRSLLTYWQHHPALSYLFSGLFIGPTSQAPRIDEARHDSLYELELAFRQADNVRETPPPWLVDRLFRNLLIDVTGNTHRAEICIDKLFSPDGPTGRLGLVEFRAFEMPPHARMCLTQQLLLLALVARFWESPYAQDLVRWGTRLHDKFMLPWFVWSDLADVVDDMKAAGFPVELEWFAPHFEFRFPLYGSVRYGDVELELRQALEPWNVLGEEGAIGGTVRFVDSSVERIQVRATGLNAERYAIGCNGQQVPMTATGIAGEYVGGVRFRAWQPASALHPTIPVDSPLVVDLYDRWTGRAVAGCTYHVAHPGGRNFETFPVNSYEAESRRLARFFPVGHSIGPKAAPAPAANPEFPLTLDLRWSH